MKWEADSSGEGGGKREVSFYKTSNFRSVYMSLDGWMDVV